MSGTDLELHQGTAELSTFDLLPKAHDLATAIAKTEFVPKGLRNRPEAVMACVLTGHELGVGPMQALAKIHVVEGRPAPSAELMRAVVLARGHELWFEESTTERVTLCGRRRDGDHTTRITWTMDDARKAGLAGKPPWRAYPRAMLTARATGELVRAIFPDVMAGLTYTAEEVDDGFDDWAPATDVEELDAGAEPGANVRKLPAKKAPAKKRAAKKAAPARKAAPPADADRPPLPGDEPTPARADEGDDEIVDAEIVDETADDPDVAKRAQRIAMKARDAGIDDHHLVVAAVTGGRETSAKALDRATAEDVLEAIRRVKVGELVLDTAEDLPRLVDAPDPDPEPDGEPDVGDVDAWDGEAWRAWLAARGVKVVAALREAKRLAAADDLDEPTSLADLQGSPLAVLVAGWVEDQAEDGAQ